MLYKYLLFLVDLIFAANTTSLILLECTRLWDASSWKKDNDNQSSACALVKQIIRKSPLSKIAVVAYFWNKILDITEVRMIAKYLYRTLEVLPKCLPVVQDPFVAEKEHHWYPDQKDMQ